MAPVTNSRPGRLLLALLILAIGLGVWAFWPGGDNAIRLGLDLRGGTQVILVPKPVEEGAVITEEQLAQTVAIIRQRVDGLGVAEAEVTTQGSGNNAAIVVSVPGVNQDRIVDLVQRTALLDFRPVYTLLSPVATDPNPPEATASPEASPSATGAAGDTTTTASAEPTPSPSPSSTFVATTSIVQAPENSVSFQEQVLTLDCLEPEARSGGTPDDPTKWLGTCDQSGAAKYVLEPAFIKGTNVSGANAVLPQNGVGWVVSLEFDSEGAKALAEASTRLTGLQECDTGAAPCNAFAIVLDGVVVSAPRFNEPILGGQAQIEGQFTAQEAKDLASVLKYGALPVTLDAVDVTTVSPTVGNDQLRAGILAGLLGLALVMLYLLIYYRALGLVAVFSLIIAGGLVYVAFVILSKTVGLTLTLAGVAGAIVAIGITADSFIVYFERIRDEIREGRTLRQACDSGWVRARRTLLAADFVSILAAVVLYFLSVGSVRGFAFVLGLTTLVDILVAFWFSHPVTVLLGRTRWMQRGSALTGLSANRIYAGGTQEDTSADKDRAGATR
ncbi:MAG: protein translocase subunit SecD [Actinomycetales bacterium]|nr:protein translocase subunit SecD [Actinomycetales bacterium]